MHVWLWWLTVCMRKALVAIFIPWPVGDTYFAITEISTTAKYSDWYTYYQMVTDVIVFCTRVCCVCVSIFCICGAALWINEVFSEAVVLSLKTKQLFCHCCTESFNWKCTFTFHQWPSWMFHSGCQQPSGVGCSENMTSSKALLILFSHKRQTHTLQWNSWSALVGRLHPPYIIDLMFSEQQCKAAFNFKKSLKYSASCWVVKMDCFIPGIPTQGCPEFDFAHK